MLCKKAHGKSDRRKGGPNDAPWGFQIGEKAKSGEGYAQQFRVVGRSSGPVERGKPCKQAKPGIKGARARACGTPDDAANEHRCRNKGGKTDYAARQDHVRLRRPEKS